MATAILDKLLQTQFGKSFIFWVFLAMSGAIVALGWHSVRQQQEIKKLNSDLVAGEKHFSNERERIIREQINFYKSLLERLEAVEKKKKR